jgi:DNA-binding response OmpR family regulator
VLKGLHAGADGYLTKPAEPATVLQAIRTVLGLQFAPA